MHARGRGRRDHWVLDGMAPPEGRESYPVSCCSKVTNFTLKMSNHYIAAFWTPSPCPATPGGAPTAPPGSSATWATTTWPSWSTGTVQLPSSVTLHKMHAVNKLHVLPEWKTVNPSDPKRGNFESMRGWVCFQTQIHLIG